MLSGVQRLSKAFEQSDADVTKLYSDLRGQILVLAGRILKPGTLAQVARPGMLRSDEAKVIKAALRDKHNFLPVDRISLGDSFSKLALAEKVAPEDLGRIQLSCGQYIHTLCSLPLDKLPTNLDAVNKLRFLTPKLALSKTARPTFQQLPLEMAGEYPPSSILPLLAPNHAIGYHFSLLCINFFDAQMRDSTVTHWSFSGTSSAH